MAGVKPMTTRVTRALIDSNNVTEASRDGSRKKWTMKRTVATFITVTILIFISVANSSELFLLGNEKQSQVDCLKYIIPPERYSANKTENLLTNCTSQRKIISNQGHPIRFNICILPNTTSLIEMEFINYTIVFNQTEWYNFLNMNMAVKEILAAFDQI